MERNEGGWPHGYVATRPFHMLLRQATRKEI
jgi:hypothetical protein